MLGFYAFRAVGEVRVSGGAARSLNGAHAEEAWRARLHGVQGASLRGWNLNWAWLPSIQDVDVEGGKKNKSPEFRKNSSPDEGGRNRSVGGVK